MTSDSMSVDESKSIDSELRQAGMTALAEAYYSDALRAATHARERAQNGHTLVVALAGTALAAFTGTQLADRPDLVKVLAAVAVIAWFASGAAFLRAAASRSAKSYPESTAPDSITFARTVLDRAKQDSSIVERRVKTAVCVTLAALALSSLTFIGYAFVQDGADADDQVARVVFDDTSVQETCASQAALSGRIVSGLDGNAMEANVEVILDTGETLIVPSRRIAAICLPVE